MVRVNLLKDGQSAGCPYEVNTSGGRVEGEHRMAELILVFCLATAPANCQEEKPALADMSLMSCLVQGQQYAADWLAEHPKWTLAGWRCL